VSYRSFGVARFFKVFSEGGMNGPVIAGHLQGALHPLQAFLGLAVFEAPFADLSAQIQVVGLFLLLLAKLLTLYGPFLLLGLFYCIRRLLRAFQVY
jgi:hypothetical protein